MRLRRFAPLLLAACTAHPLAEPDPLPDQQTNHYVDIDPNPEADILFVIDNSHSMSDEQTKLRNNFPVFLQELKRAAGGKMPSVQIGIVSSDVGAGPTGISGGCERVAGDRGALRVKPNCGLDPRARWIVTRDDEVFKNYTGDVGAVFGCLADLGIMGCGFEHQLQATRLALYPQKGINEENVGFVRPSAYLAIILVTDEDDCSGPPNSDLYAQSFPAGQAASLRCSLAGHLCRGQPPVATDGWNAPMSECRAADGGKLIAIDELVRDIRALKPRPEQIFVSGIYGVPGAGSTYRIGRDANQNLEVAPVCGSTMVANAAAAGLRIKRFVDALGGESFSICDADFTPAMRRIGTKLGEIVHPIFCIKGPVADVRPMENGVQADCEVSDRISPQQEVLIPPCPSSGACWRLAQDAMCTESGFKVDIDRKGQAAPPGTVVMKCLTCSRPDDPRCAR